MKLDPEKYDKQVHDTVNAFSQVLVENQFFSPDRYYLDLAFIKDIYLGCYLGILMEKDNKEELYQKFLLKLPAYISRRHNDTLYFFDDLSITREEFDSRISDPTYADKIFLAAPLTNFIDKYIKGKLEANVKNSIKKQHRNDITFTINTYPLVLSLPCQEILGVYMSDALGVNTEIIYHDPKDIPLDILDNNEELFIFNFSPLSYRKDFKKNRIETHKYLSKRITIPKFISETYDPERTGEEAEKAFTIIKAYYESFVDHLIIADDSVLGLHGIGDNDG